MQMLNFPTEKSPMKVKFNEHLVIENFKMCHSVRQMEAKKIIQDEPIFTSAVRTSACYRKEKDELQFTTESACSKQ